MGSSARGRQIPIFIGRQLRLGSARLPTPDGYGCLPLRIATLHIPRRRLRRLRRSTSICFSSRATPLICRHWTRRKTLSCRLRPRRYSGGGGYPGVVDCSCCPCCPAVTSEYACTVAAGPRSWGRPPTGASLPSKGANASTSARSAGIRTHSSMALSHGDLGTNRTQQS